MYICVYNKKNSKFVLNDLYLATRCPADCLFPLLSFSQGMPLDASLGEAKRLGMRPNAFPGIIPQGIEETGKRVLSSAKSKWEH